ncbi:MAG: HAD family hydrolase [Desulfobacterales bacterium]|jgi:putative hydrolase of the HAD superfamily|nr:HAD family hydrolase [Desulfobacteraceae bacterium]MDY0310695.1 HAD family hydrolase [Desulfobacterales bacterium]
MDALKSLLHRWPFTPLAPLPTNAVATGKLKNPVTAILFDVYGTLLVSAAGDIGTAAPTPPAWPAVCRSLGLDLPLAPAVVGERLQRRIGEVHRQQRDRGIDVPEVAIDEIWMDLLATAERETARCIALAYELTVNPVWPMPGGIALLETCRRCGLTLGIVSNAQFYTPLVLEHLWGRDLKSLGIVPEMQIYSYRLGHAKPSPVLFAAACRSLGAMGILPREALYVGNDMRNDVWAAQQAGLQTALFAGDARSLRLHSEDPRCRKLKPDLVVTDLGQLSAVLAPAPG